MPEVGIYLAPGQAEAVNHSAVVARRSAALSPSICLSTSDTPPRHPRPRGCQCRNQGPVLLTDAPPVTTIQSCPGLTNAEPGGLLRNLIWSR
jgi:hypothetical protein